MGTINANTERRKRAWPSKRGFTACVSVLLCVCLAASLATGAFAYAESLASPTTEESGEVTTEALETPAEEEALELLAEEQEASEAVEELQANNPLPPTSEPLFSQQVLSPLQATINAVQSISPNTQASPVNGDLLTWQIKTDTPTVILNPSFLLSNISEGEKVYATVSLNGQEEGTLGLRKASDGAYKLMQPLTLTEYPGKNGDVVSCELFIGSTVIGVFTVYCAPVHELIDELHISGLVSPVASATPVASSALSGGSGYFVEGIEWRKLSDTATLPTANTRGAAFTKDSQVLKSGESFEEGAYYTALITIKVAEGYKINELVHADVAELKNTENGAFFKLAGTNAGSVYAYPHTALNMDSAYSFWACFLTPAKPEPASTVGPGQDSDSSSSEDTDSGNNADDTEDTANNADDADTDEGTTGEDANDTQDENDPTTSRNDTTDEAASESDNNEVTTAVEEPTVEVTALLQEINPLVELFGSNEVAQALVSGQAVEEKADSATALETILQDQAPLAGYTAGATADSWALVNLLLALLSLVVGVLLLVFFLTQNKRLGLAWRVMGIALGILAPLAFLLTENIKNPLVFVDSWTFLMAAFVAAQVLALTLLRYAQSKAKETETPVEA